MKIAIIFEANLSDGGGYQQQLSTILELSKIGKYTFIFFVFSNEKKKLLEKYHINTIVVRNNILDKIIRLINRQDWFYNIASMIKIKSLFEKKLDKNEIDLVYFLAPSSLSLDLLTHNYILTVWDLCHRDLPEFPEVNHFREFEKREQLYNKSMKKAVAILTDSEFGKQNAIHRYRLDKNRIHVFSFTPSNNVSNKIFIDIKEKYKIKGDYIYYPAQFWPHKNHIYIIDAIVVLSKKYSVKLDAIFSGADKGNLAYVLNYAKLKGVSEQIKYIGFAANKEMYSLYKSSLAMVMPSYFGPTNIPPLEAFSVGTPVIYSDLESFKQQVEDAALFCDLNNPQSLAKHLINLIGSQDLREAMILKGTQRLKELQKTSSSIILKKIFDDYATKLKCWK